MGAAGPLVGRDDRSVGCPPRRNQQVRPVWVPEWGPPGPHDLPSQQKWDAVGMGARVASACFWGGVGRRPGPDGTWSCGWS